MMLCSRTASRTLQTGQLQPGCSFTAPPVSVPTSKNRMSKNASLKRLSIAYPSRKPLSIRVLR